MAETFLTNNAAGLQQGQFELASQMEKLVLAQQQLLLAQGKTEQRVGTLVEELREQRQAAYPGTIVPDPALRFDAGSRLIGTFELQEMLLREVPNETILILDRSSFELERLPPRLDTFYMQMWEQIWTSENLDLCKILLASTAVVYRPATLEELTYIVELLLGSFDNLLAVTDIIEGL
ncbi:hypothetical protein LTS10_011664 [Elasticomyces elasticus]|nr:hypothetical protein LTS10_011664 [Elasticomyces elasticus]